MTAVVPSRLVAGSPRAGVQESVLGHRHNGFYDLVSEALTGASTLFCLLRAGH